jgi:hypothetical protein
MPWRHMGKRRYSSYSYLTSALDGGEWSASRPGRALAPGKGPPVPIGQEAGWAPEPVWMQRLEEKSSPSVRDRSPVVQSVLSHCTELPRLRIKFHASVISDCSHYPCTLSPTMLCNSWVFLLGSRADGHRWIPLDSLFIIACNCKYATECY